MDSSENHNNNEQENIDPSTQSTNNQETVVNEAAQGNGTQNNTYKQPYGGNNNARRGQPVILPPSKNKPPKKPMNGWLVALCVICGCIVFGTFWSKVIGSFGNINSTSTYTPLGDTIDVIKVEGEISEGQISYNHTWTLNRIDELMESETNKGIMLYVNSPGGGIYESDELYLKLKEYKTKTGRPVYAYMAQTAASGGLYITMAADKIYANRSTMTGSIGVILSIVDTSGLEKLIGVKTENIVSGKNKAMGNPLTEEQREILQSLIDESYEIFVDVVEEGRGLDEATVKKLADGRVYSPIQAQKLGLIDEIGDFQTAVKAMKEENSLEDCELYYDEQPTSFWEELMYSISNIGSIGAKNDFREIKAYIDNNSGIKLKYMMN